MAASNEYADHKRKTISAHAKGKPTLVNVRKSKSAADVRAGTVALALDIAADNRFHYGAGRAAHHNGCYFCGTQRSNKNGIKMKKYTYCCNPFVHAMFAYGGGDPTALRICKKGSSWDFGVGNGYDKLAKSGKLFKKIHNPSPSKLLPGDVGCSSYHAKLYVGKWNGKHHICEASGGDDNKQGSKKWNNSIHVETMSGCGGYRWYRYVGNGGKMMHRLSSSGASGVSDVSDGYEVVVSKKDMIKNMKEWAKKIANDQRYIYKRWDNGVEKTHKCPVCNTKLMEEAYGSVPKGKDGWNCIGFAWAVWRHGGGLKTTCNCAVFDNGTANKLLKAKTDAAATKIIQQKCGIKDVQVIRNNGKAIPKSKAEAGDIALMYNGSTYQHTYFIMSDKYIAESNSTGGVGSRNNIRADVSFSGEYVSKMKVLIRYTGAGITKKAGSTGAGGRVSDDGSGIVLEEEIKQLYSSDNYSFIDLDFDDKETEADKRFNETVANLVNTTFVAADRGTGAIGESILTGSIKDIKFDVAEAAFQKNKAQRLKNVRGEELTTYPNLVEAPTIVLDFNGIKIGGSGNDVDIFPNYIDSMSVNKINGRINKYTLNLSHQVRPGEDPNLIDKLISRVSYTTPLKILYGDSVYPDKYFREEEAYIMDAKHSEDPAQAKINYTIEAISSVAASAKSNTTFKAVTDKPSNKIYNLLYNSGEISTALLSAFPGMQNKQLVASSGLIPNTDAIVKIAGMENTSPIAYLSTLVSSMKNASGQASSYFLTYNDDTKYNGSYFKVSEVNKNALEDGAGLSGSVYSVDVGYPSDNMVMGFQLCDNTYWSLAYKFAGNITAYDYDIDNAGNVVANKVNLMNRNGKYQQYNLIDDNWWNQVTQFPISAKLTLKGLVTSAMLMSYIHVNVMFYGQADIASGLYVVTAENDTISGNGYRTELTLLRVA